MDHVLPQEVSIVILSDAKTPRLRHFTQRAIESCELSEPLITFSFIVFEKQHGIAYKAKNISLFPQELPVFNYNAYMNLGIEKSNSEFVALCNNDILFTRGWCSKLIRGMQNHACLSASPMCPNAQGPISAQLFGNSNVAFGYNVRQQMSGWCIMINKKIMPIIGKLDENFSFWAADNAYSDQLRINNLPHVLVRDSVVYHVGSQTLNTLDPPKRTEATHFQYRKYLKRNDALKSNKSKDKHSPAIENNSFDTAIKDFQELCTTPSDINEHLLNLKNIATGCPHITEFGVRNVVSTYAFIHSKPKTLCCYDIKASREIEGAKRLSSKLGVDLNYYIKDVLNIDIEQTDFLFIDTLHTYFQLSTELKRHAKNVRKFIAFHDVTTFGLTDEVPGAGGKRGLLPAILEFLRENAEWKVYKYFHFNNGLLILKRDGNAEIK